MNRLPQRGDRVRLLQMQDDPDPIAPGTTGTVVSAARHGLGKDTWVQIDISWDNGRSLMLVSPPDEFEILQRAD
jgi:hypothetical protein